MNSKHIFVTGGAGYIGSHCCKRLSEKGYIPVTIDNLSTGTQDFVKWGPFVHGSISNKELVSQAISDYNPLAAMHFAAYINVGESVLYPKKYYHNNVVETLAFIENLIDHNIKKFVFSSTAATFGNPQTELIDEHHPQHPINPYGNGKLFIESVLRDYDRAYDFKSICFRYFNAAGCDPDGQIGERHHPETHLIPLILHAILGKIDELQVFGDDYPTPDGTCIRDYIHVYDLVDAHILALDVLLSGSDSNDFNLGNGKGFSVKDVIGISETVTKKQVPYRIADRRPGDPAILVADSQKAKTQLNWHPQFSDLTHIIQHAWKFLQIN